VLQSPQDSVAKRPGRRMSLPSENSAAVSPQSPHRAVRADEVRRISLPLPLALVITNEGIRINGHNEAPHRAGTAL
jgi:hypothetical protein